MRLIDADELMNVINMFPISVLHYTISKGYVDRAIKDAPTVGEWINVKDRLPEKEGRYLVLTSGIVGIDIAWFTLSLKRCFEHAFEDGEPDRPGFFDCDSEDDWILDDVTHWMHLPALPKEENE